MECNDRPTKKVLSSVLGSQAEASLPDKFLYEKIKKK